MCKGKIRMLFLLVLTLVGSVVGIKNVSAATDSIGNGNYVSGKYYYEHKRGSSAFYERSQFIIRKSDGAWVYCVQPFVKIKSDSTYNVTTEDLAAVANISYSNWKIIERIAYYGYGYSANGYNHSEEKWYAATQMLIWQYADTNVQSYFTSTLHGTRDDSILRAEMNEIMNLVNNHGTIPNLSGLPNEMIIGNSVTINDNNNVLGGNYNVADVVNGQVTKNGNSLTIKATGVGTLSFKLQNLGNRYGEPVRLYYATDSQNVVRRGNIDPINVNYNIKVYGGKVYPEKNDEDTYTNKPQGEATLEGAVYGIYKEDGTKVGTVTTKADGTGESDYLPSLGRFYLLEEKASTGYQLDKNKYCFEITSDNLYPHVQVLEKVINLDFDFTKVYASDKTGIMTPEVGIVFGIYNNKGEEVRRLTTDNQGNIKFNLPYGTYIVKQLTSTAGHEKVKDFTIEVKKVGTVVKKVISNAQITAKLRVVKIDSETKKVIKRSHIKFKIFDVKNNKYVCQTVTYPDKKTYCEWETDDNGEFTTAYPLAAGTYRLEELDQKIDGYLWNKVSREFTIDENSNLRNDSDYGIIFDTEFENQPVKGEANIIKTGESATITKDGFVFKIKSLEGIKFGLFAAEDIVWNGQTIIKKGSKVAEKTTDKDGKIKFDNLILGKYYIQELETLDNYVLDENQYEFELIYKDQYTPVIVYSKSILNILKTGKLEFTKTDFSESKTLPNTTIEIYTENDELVFTGKTDKEGKITINRLPQGKYYIVEKEAPEGYKVNKEKMYFVIKENGEVIKATMKDEDITGKLDFTKVDFSTDNPLPNTLIEIYDANTNELIYSERTDKDGKIVIDKIKYGKYYIVEKEAPEGYQINNDKMFFEITEDGQVVKSIMKDEKLVEVPNTDKSDSKELVIGGIILSIIGIGAITYGKKREK